MGKQEFTKTEFLEMEDNWLKKSLSTSKKDDKEEENFEEITQIDDVIEIEDDDQSWSKSNGLS